MARQTPVAGARKRRPWPQESERQVAARPVGEGSEARAAPLSGEAPRISEPRSRSVGQRGPALGSVQAKRAPGPMKKLSVRAQNVLKELAVELTGEQPPKGPWSPSRELLLALTAERLATARNCGPHTLREIVDWAQGCGVTIRPAIPPRGSLSQMWGELIANASAGSLTSAEMAGALQRSIRRKSVRIPIAFQVILVKMLLSSFE
jgi:rRNA maturation protein Nop10